MAISTRKDSMSTEPNTPLLRGALLGNALFSITSAAFVVILAGPLSDAFDIPTTLLVVLGVGLIPWAAFAWFTSRQPTRAAVLLIIAGDIVWVVGTIVLTVGFPDAMSAAGTYTFGMIAVVVGGFAITQIIGLRRSEPIGG